MQMQFVQVLLNLKYMATVLVALVLECPYLGYPSIHKSETTLENECSVV